MSPTDAVTTLIGFDPVLVDSLRSGLEPLTVAVFTSCPRASAATRTVM